MKHLIIIAGPTGVGKTAVAIELAEFYKTEIISADARQFYSEMNIGTAKPDEHQLAQVKHHFINSLSIHDAYDVSKYETDALNLLQKLFEKNDKLILCGGSGLFIHAVVHGLDKLPETDSAIRHMFEQKLADEGLESLQKLLLEKDPVYYKTVDLQNPHRLLRALEVCFTTGKPFSSFRKNAPQERNFQTISICLNKQRNILYRQINQRVDAMVSKGLIQEAAELYPLKHLQALHTVGYTEIFRCFDERRNPEEAIEKIKQNTRHYAKRQLTWFKKYLQAAWFEPETLQDIKAYINSRLDESTAAV